MPAKTYSKAELESLKRADLQKLAKGFGIKANLKSEKIIQQILDITDTTPAELGTPNLQSGPSNPRNPGRKGKKNVNANLASSQPEGLSTAARKPALRAKRVPPQKSEGTRRSTRNNKVALEAMMANDEHDLVPTAPATPISSRPPTPASPQVQPELNLDVEALTAELQDELPPKPFKLRSPLFTYEEKPTRQSSNFTASATAPAVGSITGLAASALAVEGSSLETRITQELKHARPAHTEAVETPLSPNTLRQFVSNIDALETVYSKIKFHTEGLQVKTAGLMYMNKRKHSEDDEDSAEDARAQSRPRLDKGKGRATFEEVREFEHEY